jgi:hypothetical protein
VVYPGLPALQYANDVTEFKLNERVTLVPSTFANFPVGQYPNVTYITTTITVEPPLPEGFTLDTDTMVISGSSSTYVPLTIYTVTASNINGYSEDVTASVAFQVGTTFLMSYGSALTVFNTMVTPTVTVGDVPVVYSVSPDLPDGVDLDTATGAITVDTTVAATDYNAIHTVTGTTSDGQTRTSEVPIVIEEVARNTADPADTTDTTDTTYTADTSAPKALLTVSYPGIHNIQAGRLFSVNPVVTAGRPTAWTIRATDSPFTIDANTGEISGTPTDATAGRKTLTVSATDGITEATTAMSYRVFRYMLYDKSFSNAVVGEPVRLTPIASSASDPGDYEVWSVSPALPDGLVLNTQTGEITGTPTGTIVSTTVYEVIAEPSGSDGVGAMAVLRFGSESNLGDDRKVAGVAMAAVGGAAAVLSFASMFTSSR